MDILSTVNFYFFGTQETEKFGLFEMNVWTNTCCTLAPLQVTLSLMKNFIKTLDKIQYYNTIEQNYQGFGTKMWLLLGKRKEERAFLTILCLDIICFEIIFNKYLKKIEVQNFLKYFFLDAETKSF